MPASTSARRALAICLLTATPRYWLSVFPTIRRERRRWRERAEAMPDPELRRLAIEAQREKRANVEGSAALATFVLPAWRAIVVRTQVAFQSIYDYVDTLAEQPNDQPIPNARQLHKALLVALDPHAYYPNYYAYYRRNADGGYLRQMIDTCRSTLLALPSHDAIAEPVRISAERIVGYQSLNLTESQGGHHELEQWGERLATPHAGLRWWEAAASAGSSLGVFALVAAAAQPALTGAEANAIERAYWPWIGALHSLLDSLVDQEQDARAEHRSLLSYYSGPRELVTRFQLLALEAKRAAASLPRADEHTLVLAAMVSHYLTAPQAATPLGRQVAHAIIGTLGRITTPTMRMLAIRRAGHRLCRVVALML